MKQKNAKRNVVPDKMMQGADAAVGKPFRRGRGPREGQLQHQIRAAADGGLRPGVLAQQGEVPPLDEAAAHGADDGGVRPQQFPGTLQLEQMSAVQGIVLCNDTSDLQKIPSDLMTKK